MFTARGAYLALYLISFSVFLLVWDYIAQDNSRISFFYSSPSEIFSVLHQDVSSGRLVEDVVYTLSHVAVGYLLGSLLGLVFGLILWLMPAVGRALNTALVGLASVPIFALAPLLIIWFGVGLGAKIGVVVLSIVFATTYQAYKGALRVDLRFKELKITYRISDWSYLFKIILPGTFRELLGTFKLSIGFALVGGFVAEWINSSNGVGHYILASLGTFDYARVFGGVLILFVVSLSMVSLLTIVEKSVNSRQRHL